MTGGSLPAMTFQQVMAFAMLEVEPKPIIGVNEAEPPRRDPALATLARAAETGTKADGAKLYRLSPRGRALMREIEGAAPRESGPVSQAASPAPRG